MTEEPVMKCGVGEDLKDHIKECSEKNVKVEGRLSNVEASLTHLIRLLYGFIGLWGVVELLEITQLMK